MIANTRKASCSTFLLIAGSVVCTGEPALTGIPDAWMPSLYWEAGQLRSRGGKRHESIVEVIRLINRGQFPEALAAVKDVQGSEADQRRAELALSVAGHLDVFDPEPALRVGERYLAKALAAEPMEPGLLRMQNQIELYRSVPALGLPTDPLLLPARDLIAAGKVDAGRKKAAQRKSRLVARTWVLASFFERRKDLAVILDDAEKALREAKSTKLLGLLLQHRRHAWAALAVRPDSLLYPRVLLGRMRAYYWWWRQMGERYRPMSKQGFLELRTEICKFFPNHDIVRMYRGERVPWGEGFRPDPVPEGAPGWAVNQRELRARVDHVVEWWFAHRQRPNGELGGGWEDDCETLRMWAITSLCCGNKKIEAGIRRLVDGIWTSGQLVNGYDRALKDVEHSSEMAADTSVMVALAYGDPLYFERFLQTTRTTEQVHTAVNAHGHRHFKAMKMSATEVSRAARHAVDAMYCGRAMRPAAMVAWYSGMPRAVQLVREWASAWNEDTLRAGKTKPAGIMPATVRFADDNVDGPTGKWYDPGLGNLYDWRPRRQGMVLGKILGAWRMTAQHELLAGARAQFEIMRRYAKTPAKNAAAGSLARSSKQLLSEIDGLVGMYRVYTGDRQFDDLLRRGRRGYGRFMASGDPGDVEAAHARDLGSMRFNLPMITSEVRGTDRVALRPASLLGPLTGSSVSITEPPAFYVTWRDVGPDFAALVRPYHGRGNRAMWVYSFASVPTRPRMQFWALQPGEYELRGGPDSNGDGKADREHGQRAPFEYRQRLDGVRFDLPPRTLYLLEVVQLRPWRALPAQMPDLAIMPRDIKLNGKPMLGRPCKGQIVVHNIGSTDAANISVGIYAPAVGQDTLGPLVQRVVVPSLACPADLRAKTATVEFSWTPRAVGKYRLVVSLATEPEMQEIYSCNNQAAITVGVQ